VLLRALSWGVNKRSLDMQFEVVSCAREAVERAKRRLAPVRVLGWLKVVVLDLVIPTGAAS